MCVCDIETTGRIRLEGTGEVEDFSMGFSSPLTTAKTTLQFLANNNARIFHGLFADTR